MFPTILQLGPVAISSLGVMIALGFFFASFLVWKRGREEHFEEASLMDGILLVVLAGLIISRLWYVIFNLSSFSGFLSPFDLIKNPGFSWHGALLGGIITLVIYCRNRKWNFYEIADLSVFGLVLGLVFTKIGFFLDSLSFKPIFLVEAILLMGVYKLLFVFEKHYRTYEWYKNKRGETNPGFLLLSFLVLTSLINLVSYIFQNPSFRVFKSSEFIVNLLIILSAGVLFYFRSGDRSLTISLPSFKKKRKVKTESHRFKTGMEAKK